MANINANALSVNTDSEIESPYADFAADRDFDLIMRLNWDPDSLTKDEWDAIAGNNVVAFVPRHQPKPSTDIGSATIYELPRRYRMAVRVAITAYEQSGKMVDAALAYAAHGFPIFPLDPKTKRPIPKRDPDPTGKFKDGIPGTGSFYKAACDPIIIRAWWHDHPKALIGLPMGERSGVWCTDVDTSEDHADGVAEWEKIVAQHDPIITREHRSATDGPHLLFNWHAEQWIGCSSGALPEGIEVKGHGGYIAVPPSQRKGRSYTVYRDNDPIDAPQWLIDLILNGRRPGQQLGPRTSETVSFEELSEIVSFIPNPASTGWDEWKFMAMRIFASIEDAEEGFAVFQDWSSKWPLYDPRLGPSDDRECWDQVCGCPPDHTGIHVLRKMAREHGWVPKLQKVDPTYQLEVVELEEARERFRQHVRQFLWEHVDPKKFEPNQWSKTWALQIDTAGGKTRIIIEELAKFLREVRLNGPIIYAVPQHSLSPEILKRFTDQGINARIFRGRSAIDPSNYDPRLPIEDQIKMCLRNDNAHMLGLLTHTEVSESCCVKGKNKCPLLPLCGYYAQQEDAETVDVWIVAADTLFTTHKVFGSPAAVIIDEGFWQKGLRLDEEWMVPINSLFEPTGNVSLDIHRPMSRRMLKKAERRCSP